MVEFEMKAYKFMFDVCQIVLREICFWRAEMTYKKSVAHVHVHGRETNSPRLCFEGGLGKGLNLMVYQLKWR